MRAKGIDAVHALLPLVPNQGPTELEDRRQHSHLPQMRLGRAARILDPLPVVRGEAVTKFAVLEPFSVISGPFLGHAACAVRAMLWERGHAMNRPKIIDDPAYHCLREDDFDGFRKQAEGRQEVDFSDSDLRGIDLHTVDLSKVKLRGAYLRDADLRGQDLRHMDLEGCSLLGARVGGAYFPANIAPQEIANSVQLGTRVRTTAI